MNINESSSQNLGQFPQILIKIQKTPLSRLIFLSDNQYQIGHTFCIKLTSQI